MNNNDDDDDVFIHGTYQACHEVWKGLNNAGTEFLVLLNCIWN